MNYPSRCGIRLNPKQVDGRRAGWSKLIQTTRYLFPPHLPAAHNLSLSLSLFLSRPLSFPSYSRPPLALPDHLRLTVIEEKRRCSKLFHRRISPIKMLRGAGINLESTPIPSNVSRPDASLISVRLAN